ncbi:MAG: ABC transporter substrate-binding protein [Chitinispirillales bacterium]|nr:ABC transporter substrate-binding protein [Chitinispirillales bacterium]
MATARTVLFTILVALFTTLFSCTADVAHPEPRNTDSFSPLETVRRLEEENVRWFMNNRSVNDAPYPPELKAIYERGHVVFAMIARDQKPFLYKNEQTGEFVGLDVEIAYAIANRLGVRAIFNRDATTFDDVVMEVANGRADIALSQLSLTTRRAEFVRYTQPYIVLRQTLMVNRLEFAKTGAEDQLPDFIKNFNGNLGVVDGSSYVVDAEINFPGANIVTFGNRYQAIDALFSGNILAFYHDESSIYVAKSAKENASILMKPVIIADKRDRIAMAVSANAPMLQNWLNVFIDEYQFQHSRELTIGRLINRHYGAGS